MNESLSKSKRPDTYSLEMIIVLAIITLHDFLLSNALSIPVALGRIALVKLISLDRVRVQPGVHRTHCYLCGNAHSVGNRARRLGISSRDCVSRLGHAETGRQSLIGFNYSCFASPAWSGGFAERYHCIVDRKYPALRSMVLDH